MKFNLPLENFKEFSSGCWAYDLKNNMLMIKAETSTNNDFVRMDGVHVSVDSDEEKFLYLNKVHFSHSWKKGLLYDGKVFDVDTIDWSTEHKGEPFRFVEPPVYVEDPEMIRRLEADEHMYVQNASHTFVNLRDGTLHFMGGGKVVFLNCELDVYTW